MSDSILHQITSQFNSITEEEWKTKISNDLKGDVFDKLISYTSDDIEILPFYTAESTKKYHLAIPQKQTDSCFITEKIIVDDVLNANKYCLHALENGANAIVFDLQNRSFSKEQIQQLIKGISLEIAPVFFYNYTSENKALVESIVINSCIQSVVIIQQESTVNELVYALQNINPINTKPIYFHFSVGQNYFLEIAKFRAMRWLWKQIASLNNFTNSIFLIAETGLINRDTSNNNSIEIYSNILRNTTESMSAIVADCDFLIVNSHDVATVNSDFGKRIARNVQHILQQESYFIELNDIAKGSYYIEYLTYQLCDKVWCSLHKK